MVLNLNLPVEPGQEERERLLEEAFEATWTTECSVAIDGPCQQPIVQGHIVPEARLEAISRELHGKLQVIVAEPKPIHVSPTNDPTAFETFRPAPIAVATTDYFSCNPHDRETFNIIEQSQVNWLVCDDKLMERLALCAYKAVLPIYVRQDRNARFWEHVVKIADPDRPELIAENAATIAKNERLQANRTGQVKRMLEDMIRGDDFQHMTHIIIHTGSEPLVAANTFFTTSPFLRADLYEGQVPQFITAYPSKYGQTVIRSWITPDHPELTFVDLDPKKAPERHAQAQAASALILQESEVLAISPDVWKNYGEAKRKAISEHFNRTTPYSASPVVRAYEFPDPQLINLFNTTPLVV